MRPVQRHQGRQRVPARDDHFARRASRQQRAHLCGGSGIVEEDEQPPSVHRGAVARGPVVEPQRYLRAGHTQGGEEAREGLGGGDRFVRVVAPEIDVELSVGEGVTHLLGPAHRQRGLADACDSGDGDDCCRPGLRALCGDQAPRELGKLLFPATEVVHRQGELGGYRDSVRGGRTDQGRAGPRPRMLLLSGAVQHLLVCGTQFTARSHAQIGVELPADPGVGVHGLGGSSAGGQSADQQHGEGLVQRVLRQQGPQHGGHFLGLPLSQQGVGPGERRLQTLLCPGGTRALRPRPRQPRQRHSAPQSQRLSEESDAALVGQMRLARPHDERAETEQVDGV